MGGWVGGWVGGSVGWSVCLPLTADEQRQYGHVYYTFRVDVYSRVVKLYAEGKLRDNYVLDADIRSTSLQ